MCINELTLCRLFHAYRQWQSLIRLFLLRKIKEHYRTIFKEIFHRYGKSLCECHSNLITYGNRIEYSTSVHTYAANTFWSI